MAKLPEDYFERWTAHLAELKKSWPVCPACNIKQPELTEDGICKSCRTQLLNDRRKGSDQLKTRLKGIYGNACQDCGNTETPVQLHHIVSIADGGETTPENSLMLCVDCHRKRHGGKGVGSAYHFKKD